MGIERPSRYWPTQWPQFLIGKHIEVNQSTDHYAFTKLILQGSLSTVTAAAGLVACASEGVNLVIDGFSYAVSFPVRRIQYVTNPAWLDSCYQTLDSRPRFSYRVERIVSQALGAVVSSLQTCFLLVMREDWSTQLHQHLGNYIPPGQEPSIKSAALVVEVPLAAVAVAPPPGEAAAPATAKTAPPPVPPRTDPASAPSAVPPPPPAPPPAAAPPPSAASAVVKTPVKGKSLLQEIQDKGGKNKYFTFKKGIGNPPPAAQVALEGAMARQMKPLRAPSENIEFQGIQMGYVTKGRTTLREAAAAMDIDFPVENEKDLDETLANFIQDLSPADTILRAGTEFEMRNEDYPDRSFVIRILEVNVSENQVTKASIKYVLPEPK